MFAIIDMDGGEYEGLEAFGAYRILGRAYDKLGKSEKAGEALTIAFEETLNDDGISNYDLNNLFYAEYLIANDEEDTACEILTQFAEITNYEAYNSARVPETKQAQKTANKIIAESCE